MPRNDLLTIAAITVGIVIATAVVAIGEISVRTLTNVGFQGNSQNLFTADRFKGHTRGNTPDVTASSFDAVVFTDHEGFRVPFAGYAYPERGSQRILVLGDSVAFGPGVAESETFVGLLRTANPSWAIYNSAVVGYHAGNYADVVGDILVRHENLSRVILVYCLNDITAASAVNLDKHKDVPGRVDNDFSSHLPVDGVNPTVTFVERLRQVGFISQLNDYLRKYSKLYLYLKGALTDPGYRYFLADYAQYEDPRAVTMLENLDVIATALRQRQIPITVIISPYEYQLRTNKKLPEPTPSDAFLPQRVVTEFLKRKGIAYVDATATFENAGVTDKSQLFLRFDPMHFSVAGHRVMYDVIRSVAVRSEIPAG